MEKNVVGENAYYQIAWSSTYSFDKYRVLGIPEMPGLICLQKKVINKIKPDYLIYFSCWRNGLRKGLNDITNTERNRFPEITKAIEEDTLLYKYTVIDTNISDMNDIMYWLIKEYQPILNNSVDFSDSARYRNIYLKEIYMKENEVVERIRKIET